MNSIKFEKPYFRWLFGGMGFHNSEATMTPLISDKLMNERILKTFHEIRPSFSRVFGGFHDWTKDAMNHFAEYYNKTFAKTDTAIYMVPGRAPLNETESQMEEFVNETCDKLEYLLKQKELKLIQFFCVANELSVGNTYAMLAKDLDKFKKYHQMFWSEFKKRKLDLGLIATDGSGINEFTEQIEWATQNMDEYTKYYCGHNYAICEKWEDGDFAFDDPEFYNYLYRSFDKVVQIAKNKQKRFMLAEFGIHGRKIYFPPEKSSVMVSDIPSGFYDKKEEAEYALMACVEELAAMNAGVLCTAFWTFCDYPNPFLGWNGYSDEAKARYEVGKFSGFGTEMRYNKHGLFKWDEDGNCSARAALYSVGLMSKFFKSNSTVLKWTSDNKNLICGGVSNSNGSVSLCVINLSNTDEKINISIGFDIDKPFRVYEYACDCVPENEFGDLQPFTTLDKEVYIEVKPHSLTLLTTDYIDRRPETVNNVYVSDTDIVWDAVKDKYHAYYRVFEDGKQIASTTAENLSIKVNKNADYKVKSVDRFGNI